MNTGRDRRRSLAVAALGLTLTGLLGGCVVVSQDGEREYWSDTDGNCTSRYRDTTRATTRALLVARAQAEVERNPAGARGRPVVQPVTAEAFASNERGGARVSVVRFMTDGGDGARIGLVDVVRLTDGTWFAGVWSQCIHGGDSHYPAGWPSES